MTPSNYFLLFGIFILLSCGTINNNLNGSVETIVIEKNQTDEVKICNQVWMNRNLNVSFFRNGDSITEAKTAFEWNKAGQEKRPAWCYYNNDSIMGQKYGKLYNWYAVNDTRGLAPEGWHIPTEEEWWTLRGCIKEPYNEHAEKLKSSSDDWYLDNGKSGKGNDSTGFTALPQGKRLAGVESKFEGLSFECDFWSSTKKNYGAYYVSLIAFGNNIYGSPTSFEFGMSVRCVKDE